MPRIGCTASTRNNLTVLLVLGSEERLVGMSERWTVRCSFFILIAASFPTSTSAQNPIDDEARAVTAGCHEALKRTGQLQTFDAGMCLGILKGLHYLSKDICIPPATSLGQIGDVVPSTSIAIPRRLTTIFRTLLWTPCAPRGHAAGETTFSCSGLSWLAGPLRADTSPPRATAGS